MTEQELAEAATETEQADVPPKSKGGRPKRRVRPEIRLSTAYVSRIGAECGDMFVTVSRCTSAVLSVDALAARELAIVAERLAVMSRMFQ